MEFKGEKYRITVLTDRLIRLEYSEDGKFEDRMSFAVVDRSFADSGRATQASKAAAAEDSGCDAGKQGPFEVKVSEAENSLTIETESLLLTYDKKEFSSCGLQIFLKNMGTTWHYGDNYCDFSNLGGTARTLDDADGRVRLEKGIFGKSGYAVIDDSKTPVMEDGEFVGRPEGIVDIYFFGYGRDYYGGLRDFCRLCGKMPMVPRYAFGNWWSRYYKYTEESYMEVVENFAKEEIPLSVAVIDMDWHITEVDERYGSGWTGYTWNKELFPDYKRFLKRLHDNKLAVTLNLHPADGIRPFEAMYDDMARAMGRGAGTEERKCDLEQCTSSGDNKCDAIEFDFGDKTFRDAYFETVMHPYENDGVNFWWIDWQQGTGKRKGDVDPLLLLNHYHYEDQKKRNLRPMIFSRYAGVGSHRYPVGFSGDTHVTWKSLEFQPYFTSTASNIGYGMWSHDIGGHMLGDKNLDRLIRWIEYGVFSPIMRIHSSCSPFFNKEPWLLEEPYRSIVKKFMRLRHSLIPYLYTENRRAYTESKPLVRPMYYDYADNIDAVSADAKADSGSGCVTDESYELGNQYKFGENLLVSAITCPDDEQLRLGYTRTLIPSGRWYDILDGRVYQGKAVKKLYRGLSEVPVLIPAGGIVPTTNMDDANCTSGMLNDTGNPTSLRILVGGGASGEYTLYEDDGISMEYENGAYAETGFETSIDEAAGTASFTIYPVKGDGDLVPERRDYEIVFYGITALSCKIERTGEEVRDSEECNAGISFDGKSAIVRVTGVSALDKTIVTLENVTLIENDYKKLVFEILDRAWIKTIHKDMIFDKLQRLDEKAFGRWLEEADISEKLKNAIKEVL